jgi:hypothetical protein
MPIALQLLGAVAIVAIVAILVWFGNFISYRVIKERTLRERTWDYNICCGVTDGGGINADIVRHAPVPRFELVTDVTNLPHADGALGTVLCSHTLEHVNDPRAMFAELSRIGRKVTILVPPLWDLGGALNPFEHRVIFLTFSTRHDDHLPRYIEYTPARWLQARLGQEVKARLPGARIARGVRRWVLLLVRALRPSIRRASPAPPTSGATSRSPAS